MQGTPGANVGGVGGGRCAVMAAYARAGQGAAKITACAAGVRESVRAMSWATRIQFEWKDCGGARRKFC